MRTALWLTSLIALIACTQAYQAWRTAERLRTLETANAWAAESARLENRREALARAQAKTQAEELEQLRGQFEEFDLWRAEFDAFVATTRTSRNIFREEIRKSFAAVSEAQPVTAQQAEALVTATLSVCEERLNSTEGVLADLRMRFESNRASLATLHEAYAKAYPQTEGRRWNNLMGPAVKLSGGGTIGSAVLLPGEPTSEGWRTRILTAWHVVRDIRLDLGEYAPIPVTIYSEDGTEYEEAARLLCRDVAMDVALLELTTTTAQLPGVQLASRKTLDSVRIFEPIYAVGCPLGNDPIPTYGELSDNHHLVDGANHWMISAPTYIGNSGGGIFQAETDELIAVFSKIYTHGTLRPTVIPHMGLAVPLSEIYDWLEGEGYTSLVPEHAEPVVASASSR